ncbi:MAG: hypothetical protein IPG32_13055 [Saprospirales bacterium]|nr:hypothetical protein [Saprospirales bacterium]
MTFTGPGPYSLSYDDGSGIATVINGINTNPYIFTVSPTVTTTYCLTDVSNAECAGLPTGCATVTVNTEVAVSNIGIACNATNTAFEVSFEITGGDAGTYTVLPLGSGTLTGGSFVSNPIAAGGTYSFQVTDINGCAVIVVEDPSPVICNCSSAVGQMDLALIEECSDGPVTATYNVLGQNFDGDDLLEFVLHTGSGNTLEYPLIARSATPSFSFDPGTMSYGTTYYISAIVGSDDGTGSVNDLADPCLAVAPGTPIVFYVVPTAVLSGTQDICLGDNAVLPIVLTGDAPGRDGIGRDNEFDSERDQQHELQFCDPGTGRYSHLHDHGDERRALHGSDQRHSDGDGECSAGERCAGGDDQFDEHGVCGVLQHQRRRGAIHGDGRSKHVDDKRAVLQR